jgi:hypothetical protein
MILYPVTLLVAFLHELGHALFAILSGGEVKGIAISPDGAGVTASAGGSAALTTMGGYIGSAIFGNALFHIGVKDRWCKMVMTILAALMVFVGIVWFGGIISTAMLLVFAVGLFFLGRIHAIASIMLMFLGMATTAYIIEDFDVGPSSDLQMYAHTMVIFPAKVWMYIWLGIVLLITFWNIRLLFRQKTRT